MFKPNQLENKVIVVTGGSGLIGRAILSEASMQGATVVNIDLNASGNNDIVEYKTDITDPARTKETLLQVKGRYRQIDGLINCSYPRTKNWAKDTFEEMPLDEWKQNIDLHLNSYYYLSQQILAIMKDQKVGVLVNFASIYGVVGNDFELYKGLNMEPPAAYPAIKGGIINLTRYLASLFGSYNVRVNCISPGGIFDNQNPEFVKRYVERVPMKRMGTPEDIAPVACFLVSDGAKYITGQNILVDGGWTCI